MALKFSIHQFKSKSLYELAMCDENDHAIISYKALMACNHGNRITPKFALSFQCCWFSYLVVSILEFYPHFCSL